MPDLDEPVRQYMKQEAPDKLIRVHGHDLGFIIVRIVPPPERDLAVFDLDDPVIADRDPVGVSTEIFKNTLGSVKRQLRVNDPLLPVQIGDEGVPRLGIGEIAHCAGINELILIAKRIQICDELPPEEPRHNFDWKEEAVPARSPFAAVSGQSAAGDDVVDMRMIHEILSPRVQDAYKPDLSTETLRVFRKLRQGFRYGLEQGSIEDFLIPEDEGVQQIGDGEDDVEVRYREEILSPGFDPLLLFQELAFRAVPVSAGVVRDLFRSAVAALVHMAAEFLCPTNFDRVHRAQPVRGQRMGMPVIRPVVMKDIRHFDSSTVPCVHDKCPQARGLQVKEFRVQIQRADDLSQVLSADVEVDGSSPD